MSDLKMSFQDLENEPPTPNRGIGSPAALQMDNKSLIKGFFASPTPKTEVMTQNSVNKTSTAVEPRLSLTPSRRPPLAETSTLSSTPIKNITPVTQAVTKVQQPSFHPQGQYEIVFPAGPMGLELEPVIISSERKLGCRVKDFYFAIDHTGIDHEEVMSKVTIGDVISQINGQSVLSLRFQETLDLLRGYKNAARTIVFRNISASWTSAPNNPTPMQTSSTLQRALEVASQVTNLDHVALSSLRLSTIPSNLESYSIVQPVTPAKAQSSSYIAFGKGGDRNVAAAPSPMVTPSKRSISVLTLSPKAVRDLSRIQATLVQPNAIPSAPAGNVSVDLHRVLGALGSLGGVSSLYQQSISVDSIVSKKHALLNELSKSCVMLGIAEDKQQQLAVQLEESLRAEQQTKQLLCETQERLQDATSTIESLEHELTILATQRDTTSLTASAADAEARLAYEEVARERTLREQILTNTEDCKLYINELKEQINIEKRAYATLLDDSRTVREDLEAERAARCRDQKSFGSDLERLQSEQNTIRADMEREFENAIAQLKQAEQERDSAQAETEVLRDMAHSDKSSADGEAARLRESLLTQSEWHKEYAATKENELFNLKAELKEMRSTADLLLRRKEEALRSLGDSQEDSESLAASIERLRNDLESAQKQLAAVSFEKCCVSEENASLLGQLQALESRQAALEDEVAMAAQTFSAQRATIDRLLSDLSLLREERLQEQDVAERDLRDSHLKLRTAIEALSAKEAQLLAAEESIALSASQAASDLESARAEFQIERNSLAAQTSQMLAQHEAIKEELQDQLTSTRVEGQCLQAEVHVLQQEMSKMQESIEVHKANAAADVNQAVAAMATWQEKAEQLGRRLEEQRNAIKNAAELQAEAESVLEEQSVALQTNQAELQSFKAAAARADEAMKERDEEVGNCRTALALSAAALDEKSVECESLRRIHVSAQKNVVKMCTLLSCGTAALRRELEEARSCMGELSTHNSQLMQAFKEAMNEKEILSAAIASGQVAVAELERNVSETAIRAAHEAAAALGALERASAQETAHATLSTLHEALNAEHAETMIRVRELTELSHTQEVELASLRQYCEDQRFAYLTLQEESRQHSQAVVQLQMQFTEAKSASAAIESSSAARDEAHVSREEVLVAALEEQKLTFDAERGAAKVEFAAKITDLTAQHAKIIEGFRAERARILGSYENMLEESRRCTLRAASQQHEQYEAKLQSISSAHMAELNDAKRIAADEMTSRAAVQRSLDVTLARLSTIAQNESVLMIQATSLEEKLSSLGQKYETLVTESEEIAKVRVDAEKECVLLRGLVSTSVEQTREAADRYLQQAKLELANATQATDRANADCISAKKSADEHRGVAERLAAQLELAEATMEAMHREQTNALSATSSIAEAEILIGELRAEISAIMLEKQGLVGELGGHRVRLAAMQTELDSASSKATSVAATSQKALQSATEENCMLMDALRSQQETIDKANQAYREQTERHLRLESQNRELSAHLQDAVAARIELERNEGNILERMKSLETHSRELSGALAQSRGETLHTRQQLLNARAELDALHGQVTELLTSAMTTPPKAINSTHYAPFAPRITNMDGRNESSDENVDPTLEASGAATSSAGVSGQLTSNVRISSYGSTAHLGSTSRIRAQSDQRATQRVSAEQRLLNPLQELPVPHERIDDDDDDVDAQDDADADISFESVASSWHDLLVGLTLDLHEAMVFSVVEQQRSREEQSANADNKVSGALVEASLALQALHEHVVRAPWAAANGSPVQSLPPAHDMANLMIRPLTSRWTQSDGHGSTAVSMDDTGGNPKVWNPSARSLTTSSLDSIQVRLTFHCDSRPATQYH